MGSASAALPTAVARLHAALIAVEHPKLTAAAMTADQWRALDFLTRLGATTMSQLAGGIGLTGPTATRVVDALVQRGFVYRTIDPSDRRRTVIRVGKRGSSLHAKIAADIAALQQVAVVAVWRDFGESERQALRELASCDVLSG